MQERQAASFSPIAVAEHYLKESRRKQLPRDKRTGFLLAAAHASWNELKQGEARPHARQIYNASTAELAMLLNKAPGRWNATTVIEGPRASYSVSFAPESRKQGIWNPGFFNEILAPAASKDKSSREVVRPEGFGGILVGVHRSEDPHKWLLPRVGVSAPITVIAGFEDTTLPTTVNATLTLYDPTRRSRAPVAHAERPLRADFGAALAYYPDPWWLEYAALIDPARYEDREAVYLMQPYDPDKIPVVLVHGLMSIPQMWLPVIDQIERDPELRGKFQFWTFAYPTGESVALSAMGLRESLRKAYEIYPGTKSMVMVSYSLGGLVGKMQVQTSGDAVWKAIFKDDAARLQAELPPGSLAKRSLIFEANRRVKRMVFICTPHLGSPLAIGPLGELGRRIILLPAQVLRGAGNLAGRSLAATIGQRGGFLPNSIWGLSPKSPLLLSLHPLPIQVPFHSIIGNRGLDKIPLNKSSDGVVPYWSSHLPGAVSERIVPAQHVTACQNPETVKELKRILRLHLEQML
jgi:pimeloyl-ACP methyl ester carboxylesterase